MATFYFDTSAIVKRYRKEADSEVLDKIFELKGHDYTISFWCILEFIVASLVVSELQLHASLSVCNQDTPLTESPRGPQD